MMKSNKFKGLPEAAIFDRKVPTERVVVVVKQDPYTRFMAKLLLLIVLAAPILYIGYKMIMDIERETSFELMNNRVRPMR